MNNFFLVDFDLMADSRSIPLGDKMICAFIFSLQTMIRGIRLKRKEYMLLR